MRVWIFCSENVKMEVIMRICASQSFLFLLGRSLSTLSTPLSWTDVFMNPGTNRTWAQWRMVNSLLLATVLRTCLVIISYGCKVPAGIFVPSMAVGATFGRMVGILVKALYR